MMIQTCQGYIIQTQLKLLCVYYLGVDVGSDVPAREQNFSSGRASLPVMTFKIIRTYDHKHIIKSVLYSNIGLEEQE